MVVDDEGRARVAADLERRARLGGDCRVVFVLQTQLDQPRADADQPAHPVGGIDDRIEGVEGHEPHASAATPTVGVDGAANSFGCIGPAPRAATPASIAWRNAVAIATGSPAVPTAVLSSTAS